MVVLAAAGLHIHNDYSFIIQRAVFATHNINLFPVSVFFHQ